MNTDNEERELALQRADTLKLLSDLEGLCSMSAILWDRDVGGELQIPAGHSFGVYLRAYPFFQRGLLGEPLVFKPFGTEEVVFDASPSRVRRLAYKIPEKRPPVTIAIAAKLIMLRVVPRKNPSGERFFGTWCGDRWLMRGMEPFREFADRVQQHVEKADDKVRAEAFITRMYDGQWRAPSGRRFKMGGSR